MITFVSGDVLQFTKDVLVVKKMKYTKKNCKTVLNLMHECYGDKKFKQKDGRFIKLVDFEGMTKHRNIISCYMNQRRAVKRIHDLYGG